MKTLKITLPEGHEIDKEKSTFEEIVFRPIKKQLPKSWEELEKVKGYYTNTDSYVEESYFQITTNIHKNIFSTEVQARASIALAQLSQLREVYRDGWIPRWNDMYQEKHVIEKQNGILCQFNAIYKAHFLAFQSAEIRYEFFTNFKDLIEEASPLLFG